MIYLKMIFSIICNPTHYTTIYFCRKVTSMSVRSLLVFQKLDKQ